MSNNDQHHRDIFQLDRIALFSDAVFAIAITLLIIEVKVPQLPGVDPFFSFEFTKAMNEMVPEFIGFIISFMVIGNYWKTHHSTFGFVTDYDTKLLSLNNLFLLTIVVMPFTTAFMSHYMTFQPFFIYCLNVIVSGILQIRLWEHITNEKNQLATPLPAGLKSYKINSTLISIACFGVAILLHRLLPLKGNWPGLIARLFLVSVFIVNMFTHRYYKKKYHFSKRF